MKQVSIFELIHTTELFNNETMTYFMSQFNKRASIFQILTMQAIRENGPQKQSQLANALGYTPGAMTGIVDKLAKEKYVERQPDPNDRRVNSVCLTKKGIKLLEEAQNEGHKLREQLYAILSEEEMQQLYRIQNKLLTHARELHVQS